MVIDPKVYLDLRKDLSVTKTHILLPPFIAKIFYKNKQEK